MRRRTALAAIGMGLTSIAGCIGQTGGSDEEEPSETENTRTRVTVNPKSGKATDLKIFNNTGETITIRVEVIKDGKEIISKEVSVEPYEKESNSPKEFKEISEDKAVEVIINVEGGPKASHQFEDDETDASGLAVNISTDSIEFQEHSA